MKNALKSLLLKPLKLGEVKPIGWLKNQLTTQLNGLSGHLDEFWPDIMNSGWIGGNAEGQERLPYWLDGVIPLAFQFDLYSQEKLKFFSEFRNESGREVLKPYFSEVEFYEYFYQVNITSVDILMNYIESTFSGENFTKFQEKKAEVENAIMKILEEKTFFKITGISGLFRAKNPRKAKIH